MKMDDRVRTHPKIVRAGVSGWLWFCGTCYCREHLTDGFIPEEAVEMLAPGMSRPQAHINRLLEVGLWHREPGGYRVHDFLQWNPSKADVSVRLESDRNRKGIRESSLLHAGAPVVALSSVLQDQEISRESKLWSVWREAMTGRGLKVAAIAGPNDFQNLSACCALVDDDVALALAARLLVGMEATERTKLGVKSLTVGYLKMALPDLLERVAGANKACRHRHQPPCADDVACTARYLHDCRTGVAV